MLACSTAWHHIINGRIEFDDSACGHSMPLLLRCISTPFHLYSCLQNLWHEHGMTCCSADIACAAVVFVQGTTKDAAERTGDAARDAAHAAQRQGENIREGAADAGHDVKVSCTATLFHVFPRMKDCLQRLRAVLACFHNIAVAWADCVAVASW